MSFAHEAVAAYPVIGNPDKAAIRNLLEKRFAYCLSASELASDWVAVDPVSGQVPLYAIQNSTMYAYDATDSTTSPSAVCLVSNDNKRFKTGTITPPDSVLTRSTVAQPVSPSDGDCYLVPTAATGADWAGKDGQIALYVGVRWYFAIYPIGRGLYVKDEDARYYRNASGIWTAGSGSVALAAGSVKITNVFGAKASYVVKVENQTTNAEPTAVLGTNYVIGPSPTGTHWAGNAGYVAMCLAAGVWTIIAPDVGDSVFDKSTNNSYRYTGAAWVSSAGAIVAAYNPAAGGLTSGISTTTATAGANYSYNGSTAPTQAQNYTGDDVTITYTAKKASARLRFIHRGNMDTGNFSTTLALFRDSVSDAVDWWFMPASASNLSWCVVFETVAPDALAHTYKFRVMTSNATIRRRVFSVDEFA